MLYVHPAAAGQGVGTLLYDALEKLAGARGAERLVADVSDNARAVLRSAASSRSAATRCRSATSGSPTPPWRSASPPPEKASSVMSAASASISSTPPCATARRRPASTSRSRTSARSRRCSTGSAIDYVEGGYPGANPLDTAFFSEKRTTQRQVHGLRHDEARRALGLERSRRRGAARRARPTRSASSPRPGTTMSAWRSRRRSRRTSTASATASRPRAGAGREVLVDCEHFFDGYKANPDYALACATRRLRGRRALGRALRHQRRHAPARGRGASSPRSREAVPGDSLGIHAHDDCGCAVANSLAAVEAGARQIQGTLNGLGERCGNANLVTLIGALKLKDGYARALRARRHRRGACAELTHVSRAGRRDPQPAAEPPRALRRRQRLRDQGRHPRLRRPEGPAHLRARGAGDRRQRAQVLVSDQGGRSNVLAELEARRHRARQGRPARRPRARGGQAQGGGGLRLRGRRRLVLRARQAHARRGAGLLRRRALLGQRRAPLQRGRRARHGRRRRSSRCGSATRC